MKYFKGAQFVPAKGEALMFYECLDDGITVARQCTFITGTGEATRTDKPVVKKLFRPEMLQESTHEEFEQFWGKTETP